ncbi:MAG: glutamine amidotransferase [Pirellulaceae bacterium]
MFDKLFIGAPQWTFAAIAVVVVSALFISRAYSGRLHTKHTGLFVVAGLLKWIALGALAFCLLQPMLESERPRPHANLLGIVLDNSRSMTVRDPQDSKSRGERLADYLHSEMDWQVRVSQDFDVRRYAFDRGLRSLNDLRSTDFSGSASALHQSLQRIASRFDDRPVAGLMLFTDGIATDTDDAEFDWSSLGFPIYPVAPTSSKTLADVTIEQVRTTQTNFEASPVTLAAVIGVDGITDQKIVAQLTDESGKVISERINELTDGQSRVDVEFQFRPEQSGLQFYKLQVFPESQRALFQKGKSKIEGTLVNNSRLVAIQRDQGPYRILYVAGRPNWEFKFIRRALAEDDEVRLIGLLRIAKKEAKFSFRDRGVNSSNPLFSGFDKDEEESAEQYDEPVLVRLGIDEARQLSKGFPQDDEELFGYHGIILDDVDASFFTQEQMLMLRRFVSARGGGLLMLGGLESFGNGGYEHTPLADLMPVYLPRQSTSPNSSARLELSREGWLQPWLRLRQTEAAEQNRIAQMPSFATVNTVSDVKPGASTLALAQGDSQKKPALVVQRFGKGQSAALLVGDLWRWAMHRKQDEEKDLQQLWRQVVRWMIADVPRAVQIDLDVASDSSRPVNIAVTVRDPSYLPLDNATMLLTVTSPGGEPLNLPMLPSAEQPGVYEAAYWPTQDGAYRVAAVATGPDGADIGRDASGWVSESAIAEFQTLRINESLLEQIARQTGGRVLQPEDLDRFARELPNTKVPLMQRHVAPLWHEPWVLALALACLCGEWGIRRFRGLP